MHTSIHIKHHACRCTEIGHTTGAHTASDTDDAPICLPHVYARISARTTRAHPEASPESHEGGRASRPTAARRHSLRARLWPRDRLDRAALLLRLAAGRVAQQAQLLHVEEGSCVHGHRWRRRHGPHVQHGRQA